MKDVLTVHTFRNLELAGGQAGDDFDMEEENNRKKQLEDLLHQVCFQIFFSLYLVVENKNLLLLQIASYYFLRTG